jgi:hypothetical protein
MHVACEQAAGVVQASLRKPRSGAFTHRQQFPLLHAAGDPGSDVGCASERTRIGCVPEDSRALHLLLEFFCAPGWFR